MPRSLIAAVLLSALAGPAGAADPVVAYTITNGSEIAESLTGAPGDAARGADIYRKEPRAGCPACHGVPGGAPAASTAPALDGVGSRLSPGALRLWIVAPSALASQGSMPAFYAAGQRTGADDPLYGGPALTAEEVEDLVAYLASLKASP